MLVLLCHAQVPFVEGGYVGLDIFFVLSGYLITGLILAELRRTGTVSLMRFYARRARRLLPLSVFVLVVVTAAALALFPPVRAGSVAVDVIAAGLYFVNWRFMAESIDYFAASVDVSPVQHYWSLSLEEQFYLVWPVILLLGARLARRRGEDVRLTLSVIVMTLAVALFAYGVWFTARDVEQAYFSTLARGWELALGGMLALALPAGIRLGRAAGTLLSGGALAAIVIATLTFKDATPYPGWRALIATVATAAYIVAGTAVRPSAPIRLLMLSPFQYLGRISYAWYLWHWPAIVFAMELFGELSMTQLLLVIAIAWIPTTITHHAIEERFRHSRTLARRPRWALALGGACTATAVVVGLGLSAMQPRLDEAPASAVPGAAVVGEELRLQASVRRIRPAPHRARYDKGQMFEDGCLTERSRLTSRTCVYGDPRSKTTVVLFGDSHAMQYFPALERIARQRGWRLVGLTRAGCPIADVSYLDGCDAWRENTLRRIERRERPALVVTSSSTADRIRVRGPDGARLDRRASQPLLVAGYARTLRRLRRTGAQVVVIRDQIRTPFNPPDCVAEHPRALHRCTFPRKRIKGNGFDAAGARRVKGVRVVDPLNVLCTRRRCPSVIGNALVYRDTYHLSATFAATLAPWLDERLPDLSTHRPSRSRR